MLTFRSLNIRELPLSEANIHFDLAVGFAEPPAARGEDQTLPGLAGTTRMVWMPDHKIIELPGFVKGTGATLEERQESWREATDALMAAMQFDDDPGPLIVGPGDDQYLGLDQAYAINAVAINTIGGPVLRRWTFQAWSIQLRAYDPFWVPSGSS